MPERASQNLQTEVRRQAGGPRGLQATELCGRNRLAGLSVNILRPTRNADGITCAKNNTHGWQVEMQSVDAPPVARLSVEVVCSGTLGRG
jgi:hypothetical protein